MPKIKETPGDVLADIPPEPTCDVPFWKGPEVEGVTQSLLNSFLTCRERFRLRVIEGLSPPDAFNKNIEYGSMWHEAEEGLALDPSGNTWQEKLMGYADKLCEKYPLAQPTILHWYRVVQVQFPLYVAYWEKKDKRKREWFMAEETFAVPYELPDGRKPIIRGKRDGGFKQARKKKLRENKTKGEINESLLMEQLGFDLQTLFYITAYNVDETQPGSIYNLEYNVVRRPLSGGKGSIRKHKATGNKPAETDGHFYGRVKSIIEEDPAHFFMRWDVVVSKAELENFQHQFLDPILTQLCDWWEEVTACYENGTSPFVSGIHWRHPFGTYNPINETGRHELDTYLATGSEVGLERGVSLFPELE